MIQVIERCFTILAKVAEDPQRIWSISEMAALIDVQPPTCFHIVNSMVELGYLERLGMRRGYRLGPAVNGLCHNFAYRPELVRVADSLMRQFVQENREGIVLAVLKGTKRYVICEAKPGLHHKLQVNYNPTVIEDVYYTATGLLLLGHCTRQEQEKFLAVSGLPGKELWPAVRTREEFFQHSYDCIVDAIDLVSCKLDLIETAHTRNIPIISAMGTGNKLDAQQLRIADLSKTEGCPLARVVRKELKARGIVHHPVVFSPELPSRAHDGTETPPPGRRSIPASSMWVPASAGLLLAQWVISYLTDEKTAH